MVLGGGSIGCELGQAFARLGSQVTIIEGTDRVLPREDAAASAVVAAVLMLEGVRVMTGVLVAAVDATDGPGYGGRLSLQDGSHVEYDELLVAVGRAPRTAGMGLAAAGVDVDQRGFVVVDKHLRTTNRHIWAAGDLTAHPQFTHAAGVHASLAASNAILGLRRSVDTATTPRVTFSCPPRLGRPKSDEGSRKHRPGPRKGLVSQPTPTGRWSALVIERRLVVVDGVAAGAGQPDRSSPDVPNGPGRHGRRRWASAVPC